MSLLCLYRRAAVAGARDLAGCAGDQKTKAREQKRSGSGVCSMLELGMYVSNS
jgi:hypothetical protein